MITRKMEEVCDEAERELRSVQNTIWRLAKETGRHEQWALRYTLFSLTKRLDEFGREFSSICHVASRKLEMEKQK